MGTRIRHLAILSDRAPQLAHFYQKVFGMNSGTAEVRRTALLGDGYLGLNINPGGIGKKLGLNHWGFEVDDIAEVQARLLERYPRVGTVTRPSNRPFAGTSTHDPEGNIFDLSGTSATWFYPLTCSIKVRPAELVVVAPMTTRRRNVRWHVEVGPPEGGLRDTASSNARISAR